MSSWSEFLLLASRDAALLALVIGVLLLLLVQHISAGWRHGLWLLVPLRLMMPVLPTSPVSWQRVMPADRPASSLLQSMPTGENFISAPVSVEIPVNPAMHLPERQERLIPSVERPSRQMTKWEIAGAIWLVGMGGCLGLGTFLTFRFSKRLKRFEAVNHSRKHELEVMLAELGSEFGWRTYPQVRVTEAVEVPALFGVLRPEILVPPSALERLSATELRLVLLHELGHWRRRDLWVNLILAVLQAIHWFNPLVWWAFHRTRVEGERATDTWVLHRAGVGQVANYGKMLLHVLEDSTKPRLAFSGMVSVVESPKDLRRRMVGIGRFTGKQSRLAVASSVVLLLGLAAAGLTQPPMPEGRTSAASGVLESDVVDTFLCRVKSTSGTPVPDAEVFLGVASPIDGAPESSVELAGKTNSKGEIAILMRPEWRESFHAKLHFFVRHVDQGTAVKSMLTRFVDSPVQIFLEKGMPLHFRVLDERGSPISNLRLRVAQAGILELPQGFWDAVTNREGRCTINGLPPGEHYVDHTDAAYGQVPGAHSSKFQHSPETDRGEIELKLAPASSVSGTVRFPDGNPVANAKVKILEQYHYSQGGCSSETVTDQNGYYLLPRLLASDYDIRVTLDQKLKNDWAVNLKEVALKDGEHRKDFNLTASKGGG